MASGPTDGFVRVSLFGNITTRTVAIGAVVSVPAGRRVMRLDQTNCCVYEPRAERARFR